MNTNVQIESKRVTITNRTAAVIGRMGLAFPAGSEERAAATLLLTKFAKAEAIQPITLAELEAAA
jgi:hypothetical protein